MDSQNRQWSDFSVCSTVQVSLGDVEMNKVRFLLKELEITCMFVPSSLPEGKRGFLLVKGSLGKPRSLKT